MAGLSPLPGLGLHIVPKPTVKTVGYYRMSLTGLKARPSSPEGDR